MRSALLGCTACCCCPQHHPPASIAHPNTQCHTRRREAANAQRFAELYCPILPEIVVPDMYTQYTTAR